MRTLVILLCLAGCSTGREITKTLEALDRTANAASKAEDRVGLSVARVASSVSNSLAHVNSLTDSTTLLMNDLRPTIAGVGSMAAALRTKVEDPTLHWLVYAIGVGVVLALLHSVFATRSVKKVVRALHADVTRGKVGI